MVGHGRRGVGLNLSLSLRVNGEERQNGNTSNMIFPVHEVVRYLSQFMVLEPGDVVNTGTPAGVGLGMDPPTYLRPGDVVELGIEGLGRAFLLADRSRPAPVTDLLTFGRGARGARAGPSWSVLPRAYRRPGAISAGMVSPSA